MRWADGFIAVDWGTTNRRAYRIDGQGEMVARFEDDVGVLAVPTNGFPAAIQAIRSELGDLPLLLAGMVGSNRGWVEAPYAPCPANLDDLASAIMPTEDDRAVIVPGLSIRDAGHADVMRGEEVQLLGAVAAGLIPEACIVCHPGTHNKWATVADGRIVTFRTVMTGEIFSLLREGGILSQLLVHPVTIGDAFRKGASRGLGECTLAAELFSVRARVLLGESAAGDAASYTSGLLIGADVRMGLGMAAAGDLVVMGRPELTGLYAAAVAQAGRRAREVDGEAAFLAGAAELVGRIS